MKSADAKRGFMSTLLTDLLAIKKLDTMISYDTSADKHKRGTAVRQFMAGLRH